MSPILQQSDGLSSHQDGPLVALQELGEIRLLGGVQPHVLLLEVEGLKTGALPCRETAAGRFPELFVRARIEPRQGFFELRGQSLLGRSRRRHDA